MQTADLILWLGDTRLIDAVAIRVHARADLPDRAQIPADADVAISVATGAGMNDLWRLLHQRAVALLPPEDMVALNQRQRGLLARCADSLAAAGGQGDLLLFAEELRLAMRALDQLAGRSDVDAMLDALFTRFCLGK